MATEYKIIRTQNAPDLELEVARYLAKGWKPQGGVSVALTFSPGASQYIFYVQAMILETPELEELSL